MILLLSDSIPEAEPKSMNVLAAKTIWKVILPRRAVVRSAHT